MKRIRRPDDNWSFPTPMPEEFVVSLTRVVMRVEMPQVVEFTQIRQVGRT